MRNPLLSATAAVALVLATDPARAAVITGNELLEFCEDRGGAGYALCVGYITGIADLTQLLTMKNVLMVDEDGSDATPGFDWCRPRGVTNGQLADLMARELRTHPEHRHLPALPLIMRALRASFPC